MIRRAELAVLGAGPAGIGAALAASDANVDVLLLDRANAAGGQVYRRPSDAIDRRYTTKGLDQREGERLRQRLKSSQVTCLFDRTVWSVQRGFRIDAVGPEGTEIWEADKLVVASGTIERVIPFPGWTIPGVMGLAATTVLLKSQRMLPGQRPVIAGSGPLLWAVAGGIVAGGGLPVAVVDLAGIAEWMASVPALLSRPVDLRRGLRWMQNVREKGVPVIPRAGVHRVCREGESLAIEVVPHCRDGTPRLGAKVTRLEADALCIGHGLIPTTETTRLLGAEHVYDAPAGGWKPVVDLDQRTSVSGLFAAGDCTGITGAATAYLEGQLAGLAVALEMGRTTAELHRKQTKSLQRQRRRLSRAGARMAELMAPRTSQTDAIGMDTVVCRCEDITRAEIEEAFDAGALGLNQLKSWTRCGMGPCQGRMCGDTVAAIAARRFGGRTAVGLWSPRVPLVPLPMENLVGSFSYDDIPIPEAAPL